MAAGDTQNDFARSMAEKLKYLNQEIIDKYPPDEPVSIINLIVPSPGKEAEAQAAMAEYCTAVVEKKAGCIQFQLSKAVRFPDGAFQFVHHEKWENPAALQAHAESEVFKNALADITQRELVQAPEAWFITAVTKET